VPSTLVAHQCQLDPLSRSAVVQEPSLVDGALEDDMRIGSGHHTRVPTSWDKGITQYNNNGCIYLERAANQSAAL